MNKKCISVLALSFTVLFVLAACGRGSRYGALITDMEGMTHVLVTDENGVTIQNENRHLVEIVTDSDSKKPIIIPDVTITVTDKNGEIASEYYTHEEYQTQSITFPAYIENKDSVEVADYIMPKPKGWEMTGSSSIMLKHIDTDTIIDTYKGDYATIQEGLDSVEEMRVMLTKDIPYSTEDYEICGTTGVKCHYDLGDTQRYLYFVDINQTVYRFGVTVSTNYAGEVDFERILNNIEFR